METNKKQVVVERDKLIECQVAKIIKEFNQIAGGEAREYKSRTHKAIVAYEEYKELRKDKSLRMTIDKAAKRSGISAVTLNRAKGIYEMSSGEMPYAIGRGRVKKIMLTKEKTKEVLKALDIENQMKGFLHSKSAKFSFSVGENKTLFKYLEEPKDTNSIAGIYNGIRLLLEDALLTEPPIKNADYASMLHTEEAKRHFAEFLKFSNDDTRVEQIIMIVDILNSLYKVEEPEE